MDRPGNSRPRRPGGREPIRTEVEGLSLRDPSLPAPTVGRTAQDRIGRELRGLYAELERQPVPRRLLDLLDGLEDPKGRME
jgi:Anti-sigma factor NepR